MYKVPQFPPPEGEGILFKTHKNPGREIKSKDRENLEKIVKSSKNWVKLGKSGKSMEKL